MYVIFPSNTPAASFPENKSSTFTVPFRIDTPFDDKWKLGLVHIQIPLTFYNVEADESITIELENGTLLTIHPEEGTYTSPAKLVEMLIRCSDGKFFDLQWDFGFTIRLKSEVARVRFSPRLGRLLGLSGALQGDKKSSNRRFDPWINHKVLLVLCSLVRPVRFNDRHEPILQTLMLQTPEVGGTYFNYFNPIDFVEVQGESHSAVTFSITDLDGAPIRFRSGNVVLGLTLQHGSSGRRDSNHR